MTWIVLISIASVIESAKSQEVTGSSDLPDHVHTTHSAVSPDGDHVQNDAPSSPDARTLELHHGGSGCQNDTVQPRSRIPPVLIYPPPPPPRISFAEMNIPPPPPMTVTNGPRSSLSPVILRSASLDKLESEQQSLRDLRDKLLGKRFSVAAKRKELRNLHIQTGAKDGYVFKLLRQYLNDIGAEMPPLIEEALTDASLLRDQLGLLEVEYDEAEASYNTLEWKYSRRETRFVEQLLDNKLVPSDTLDRSQSAENLEILQLTNFMAPSTNDDSRVSSIAASSDEASAEYTLEPSAFLAKQDLVTQHIASMKFPQARSVWSNLNDLALTSTKDAHDIHPTHKHLRWVEKMSKIDEWLFDIVDHSSSQKLGLKAMHDFGFADTGIWWEHTKWLLVQDYSTYFHTGDSTVFDYATGQSVSKSPEEGPSSVPSIADSCSTSQQLLRNQLTGVPDTSAFPSIVQQNKYRKTNNHAHTLRKLRSDTRKEQINPVLKSQSLRNRSSTKSIATDGGGSLHRCYYSHRLTRSLSCLEAPSYIEREEGEQISWHTVSPISRHGSRRQRPYNGNSLRKRHTMPVIKKADSVISTILPRNSSNTSFSLGNFPQPVFDPGSRNLRRRLPSYTSIGLRQSSEKDWCSSLATSNLKSAQSPQHKSSTSAMDRCLVM
jgi:hypothetical protein